MSNSLQIVELKPSRVTPPSSESKKKKKKTKPGKYDPKRNRAMVDFCVKVKKLMDMKSLGVTLIGDIPYNWSTFWKGTQAPTIRLYGSRGDMTLVAATNNTFVYSLQASVYQNFSDLAAVFDEYRPIRAQVEYYPIRTDKTDAYTRCLTTVCVVDYDDATALASFDSGLSYDTKQLVCLQIDPYKTKLEPATHLVEFEPLPDQEWLTTSTTNQVFATWKFFTPAADITASNAGVVGFVTSWMDFQFRGSD